jgi:hypothetical protein
VACGGESQRRLCRTYDFREDCSFNGAQEKVALKCARCVIGVRPSRRIVWRSPSWTWCGDRMNGVDVAEQVWRMP